MGSFTDTMACGDTARYNVSVFTYQLYWMNDVHQGKKFASYCFSQQKAPLFTEYKHNFSLKEGTLFRNTQNRVVFIVKSDKL